MPFKDRRQAGRALAELLGGFGSDDPVVLALPRGGVVVGAEVADGVGAPLDVVVVRKLHTPDTPALGLGAIAEDDVQVLLGTMLYEAGLSPIGIAPIVAAERAELAQ